MKKLLLTLALSLGAIASAEANSYNNHLSDYEFFRRDMGVVYLHQWQHLGNNVYQCNYLRRTQRGNYIVTTNSIGMCRNSGTWMAINNTFRPH